MNPTTRMASLHWVATLLLGVAGLASAGGDACPSSGRTVQETHLDWQVACRCKGAKDKRCVAYTEVIGYVGGVYGRAHILSFSANAPGQYRLGWDPRLYVPDGKHPLLLQVDNGARRSISAGKAGYSGNEADGYRIAAGSGLINEMKRGRELTIHYTDVFGGQSEARFSLMGVTKSLRFADARLGAKKPAPKKAAPVAKPTAKNT